ncbi:MAG TPA: hypothetical protein VG966_04125 [Hyphomicrobiaceae bacterium]|nr:hypothetical protein [Hyphomicrobiaceae bacterium]
MVASEAPELEPARKVDADGIVAQHMLARRMQGRLLRIFAVIAVVLAATGALVVVRSATVPLEPAATFAFRV